MLWSQRHTQSGEAFYANLASQFKFRLAMKSLPLSEAKNRWVDVKLQFGEHRRLHAAEHVSQRFAGHARGKPE
jgi:hypothetical protein